MHYAMGIKTINKTNMTSKITIRYNNDHALIAWYYGESILHCIGFALYRKKNNDPEELVENQIGFADEPLLGKTTPKPSNKYPLQRFVWTDFKVNNGDTVNYKVVPIVFEGGIVKESAEHHIDYLENPVTIGTGTKLQAYFNVGLVSSQFYAHWAVNTNGKPLKPVTIVEADATNPIRNFLGGELTKKLFDVLDAIKNQPNTHIYLALFELEQEDLIEKLTALGNRCHLILANGALTSKNKDKNSSTRIRLAKTNIDLHDRIVEMGHLSHNKFMVIGTVTGTTFQPKSVWTGSLNWTPNGLFGQVNNSVLIEDDALATSFYEEWQQLKTAGNTYPAALYAENDTIKKGLATTNARTWFNPLKGQRDLADVRLLLDNAKDGILFLMFNPGTKDTLYNKIQELSLKNQSLYVRGVLNQEPKTKGGHLVDLQRPVKVFSDGKKYESDWETILPSAIKSKNGWQDESTIGLVRIHSKIIVIDPFGANPYVITGSNNMGPKASGSNDDNLNIIADRKLAEEYAVNIISVYNHYHFRFSSKTSSKNKYRGLTKDLNWMPSYLTQSRDKELQFWTK